MAETAKKLRIYGRVQGVFYRAWTTEKASALGLNGWVRNRHDGSVELLAKGRSDAVEQLIGMCRDGPPAALVERIDIEEAGDAVAPDGFEQRPTA